MRPRFQPSTRRIAALFLTGALAWAPPVPSPVPLLPTARAALAKKGTKDPTKRQIRALLSEGKKAYKAGDVLRAKELWTRAAELAKTSSKYRDELLAAVVNLAEANYQIYLATRDVDKLVHARDLFEYYVTQKSSEKKLSAKEEQLLVKLQVKIAELDAKIEAEKRRRRSSPYDRMSQRETYRAAFAADPDRQRGKAMMGFGGFLAGAGFVTFTAGPAIAAAHGNLEAVIGTAVAGVLVGVVGAAVLGAGVATWRRARYRARRKAGLALYGVGGACLPGGPTGPSCTFGLGGAF